MDELAFKGPLLSLLTELVGKRSAERVLEAGDDAFVIRGSGIDPVDQPDFWDRVHIIFGIAPPWADDELPKTGLGRVRQSLSPKFTYEFPDLTVGQLRLIASRKEWPPGSFRRLHNRS